MRSKEYYAAYRVANREKINTRTRAWKKANPEKIKASRSEKTKASALAWKAKNKERWKKYRADWVKKHPEVKREINRRYRERHKDMINARLAAWRKTKPESGRAARRRWIEKNRGKLQTYEAARRGREAGAGGNFSPSDVAKLLILQKGRCAVCRDNLGKSFHRDHIVPLVSGGSNEPSNIQLLCGPCNCSKSVKDPVQFMQSRGLLL